MKKSDFPPVLTVLLLILLLMAVSVNRIVHRSFHGFPHAPAGRALR